MNSNVQKKTGYPSMDINGRLNSARNYGRKKFTTSSLLANATKLVVAILLIVQGSIGVRIYGDRKEESSSISRAHSAINVFVGIGVGFLVSIAQFFLDCNIMKTLYIWGYVLLVIAVSGYSINRLDAVSDDASKQLPAQAFLYGVIGFGIGMIIAFVVGIVSKLNVTALYILQAEAIIFAMFLGTASSISLFLYTNSKKTDRSGLITSIIFLVIAIIVIVGGITLYFFGG